MSETYNTPPPSCAGSVCLFSLQQTSDMLPGPNTVRDDVTVLDMKAPEDGTEGDPASIQHLPAMAQQPDAMNRMNSILGGTLDLSNINTAEQTRVSDAIQMAEIMGLADLSRTTRASEHHSSSSDEVNIIVSDMMRDQKQAVQQPQGRAIRGAGPSQSTPRKESAMEFPRPSLENAGAGGGEWNINDIMAILATQKQQQQPLRAPPATPASVAPQSAAGLYESLYRTPASVNPVLDPALAAGLVYPFMSTPDSQYSDSINRSPAPDLSALSSDSSALSMAYLRDIMANLSLSQHTPGRSPTSPLMLPQRNVLDESALFSADMRTRVNAWNNLFATNMTDPFSIEKAARLYRNAAAVCDATCTWSGQLPPRNYKNPVYSCKVFVGGVPWDITELALVQAFKQFGTVHVEWPGKEARYAKAGARPSAKGYVYIIFDSEKSVKALLQNCQRDYSNSGDWYFKLTTRRLRTKEIRQVQVIPWVISDSTYVRCNNQRMDPNKTVFVGALHGMVTAEVLALVMNDLFGGVVYAGIDTDKYKYPIGSGRVTFNNQKSYFKAVMAAFVEIKSPKFTKKVQIDPYLEDAVCSNCGCAAGPYFCREMICFRYFCRQCWQGQHGSLDSMRYHKPLMRNTRTGAAIRATRLPDMPGPGTSNGSYQQVNPTAHLSGRLPSGVPQFGVPPPILPYCIPRASG